GGARHQIAGAVRLEVGERHPLEMREEIVPQVVLEPARRADDDPPHLKTEVTGDAGNQQKQTGRASQLRACHARGQVVDGELQHARHHRKHGRRHREAHESEGKFATVPCEVWKKAANRSHFRKYKRWRIYAFSPLPYVILAGASSSTPPRVARFQAGRRSSTSDPGLTGDSKKVQR